jgi:hypothetical protein
MDKGYQDLKFYTEFRCAGTCDAGVLLRTSKTSDGGWKGVYVSLSGDGGSYDLTLNAEGKAGRTRSAEGERAVRTNGRALGKRELRCWLRRPAITLDGTAGGRVEAARGCPAEARGRGRPAASPASGGRVE